MTNQLALTGSTPAAAALALFSFPKTEEGNVVPFTDTALVKELGDAIAEYDRHVGSAVKAAIRIGHAATMARDLLPDGKFTPWLAANFPQFSPQWARTCMRASLAFNELERRAKPDEVATIIERMTSVEKMAALVGVIKGVPMDESPLSAIETATQPAKRTGRPPKSSQPPAPAPAPAPAPRSAKLEERPEQAANRRANNDEWEIELEAWEDRLKAAQSQLEAKQQELQAWEARLEERERKLTLAVQPDADTGETVTDVVAKDYAGAPKPEWPATPAQTAAASSGGKRKSRAKPKGDTNPAPQAENGSQDEAY